MGQQCPETEAATADSHVQPLGTQIMQQFCASNGLYTTALDDANLVCYIQRIIVLRQPDVRLLCSIRPAR